MLEDIDKLLIEGNFQFQSKINKNPEVYSFDQRIPKYPLLFLTCMDPRIDVHQIFQFNPGDVFILRNAGNIYTTDIMRSILIAIYKYNIKYIVILGHLDCGMTKIDLKRLRERLPNQFLKRLTINYSDLLSKLYEFFKPFENEISNVIMQLNNLQETKAFFPEVEIIGMLYDTQTGWIFTQEDFRDLLIKENHYKIYERLLMEKKQRCSKFLEERKSYQVSNERADENLYIDLKIQKEPEILEMDEESININITNDLQNSNNLNSSGFQIKMPKIRIPKIIIPQLKIHIPRNTKKKDD